MLDQLKNIVAFLLIAPFLAAQTNAFRPDLMQSQIGTPTVVFPNNVTSGNLGVVCAVWNDVGVTLGVTDFLGTSYTATSAFPLLGGTNAFIQMFYGVFPSSGSDTVTFSGAAGHHIETMAAEFTNISGTLDGSVVTASTTTSAPSVTITPTTTVNGDMVVSCTMAAGAGGAPVAFFSQFPMQFVADVNQSFAELLAFGNLGAAGAYSLTTFSTPVYIQAQWGTVGLVFKPAAISIATSELPHGAQTTAYKATLVGVGGVAPYTWTALSGLPGWASLNSSTGVITGTPNLSGCSTVSFQVTDGSTTATRSLPLCSGASFGTISNVQVVNGTSSTVTLPGVSSGHEILILGSGGNGGPTMIGPTSGNNNFLSDTFGTTFKRVYPITVAPIFSGTGAPTIVWAGCASSNGSDTIVYTSTGGIHYNLEAEEWANVQKTIDDGASVTQGGSASNPFSIITGNYNAQVANETLRTAATTGSSSDTLTLTGMTSVFNAGIGGSTEGGATGFLHQSSAGTYTASASLNAADSTRAMFSLQLIGLRPAVTGLGCNGTPVASGSIAQWSEVY